jgi:hypothetical protein
VPAASSSRALRTGAAIASASGVTLKPRKSIFSPYSPASRVASVLAERRACASVASSRRRAIADQLCAVRELCHRGTASTPPYRREIERRRHHADDRRRFAADVERLADSVGAAVQQALPQRVRDDDDVLAFARVERAAEFRRGRHRAEEVAADPRRWRATHRAAVRDRPVAAGVERGRRERIVGSEVGVVRIGERHRMTVGGEFAHLHEPLGTRIGEVAQQLRR